MTRAFKSVLVVNAGAEERQKARQLAKLQHTKVRCTWYNGVLRTSVNNNHIRIFGEVLFDHFPDDSCVLGGASFNVAWHFWLLLKSLVLSVFCTVLDPLKPEISKLEAFYAHFSANYYAIYNGFHRS